ncbi:lysoplasmalogenase [Arenibacterium sp. CAU 1754]
MSAPFIIAALAALAYLPLAARPVGLVRSVLKTLSVAALAVGAFLAGAPLSGVALALCALGDWLLSRDGDGAFMAGVGAFAAGHVAYIVLFLFQASSDWARLIETPALYIAIALAVLGVVMAPVLARRAGDLRGPVLGYVPIILGMGFAALTLPGKGPLVWVMPAAVSFIISDLVLASEKFLLPPAHSFLRFTPYVIWVLYWGAQAGFFFAFSQGF